MSGRSGDIIGLTVAVLSLLAASGCTRIPTVEPGVSDSLLDLPVESWREVDCEPINERIAEAAANGREWAASPTQVLLESLGGDQETVLLELVSTGNRGESPDTVYIEIARDRFMDDSVRGDRHEAILRRVENGTWRLHSLRKAFRCWRGDHPDSYSADFCL